MLYFYSYAFGCGGQGLCSQVGGCDIIQGPLLSCPPSLFELSVLIGIPRGLTQLRGGQMLQNFILNERSRSFKIFLILITSHIKT